MNYAIPMAQRIESQLAVSSTTAHYGPVSLTSNKKQQH